MTSHIDHTNVFILCFSGYPINRSRHRHHHHHWLSFQGDFLPSLISHPFESLLRRNSLRRFRLKKIIEMKLRLNKNSLANVNKIYLWWSLPNLLTIGFFFFTQIDILKKSLIFYKSQNLKKKKNSTRISVFNPKDTTNCHRPLTFIRIFKNKKQIQIATFEYSNLNPGLEQVVKKIHQVQNLYRFVFSLRLKKLWQTRKKEDKAKI